MRLVAVALALVLAAGAARADVDWRAGRVTARGVGPADLRAPGPDIARAGAERVADETWKKELRDALRGLRIAGGGTLGKQVDKDPAAAAALSALVDGAEVEKRLYSDGRWWSRPGSPSTRRRGSPALRPMPARSEPLVVDARKVKLEPAIGYRVKADGVEKTVAARFVEEVPETFGAKATGVKGGVVSLATHSAPPVAWEGGGVGTDHTRELSQIYILYAAQLGPVGWMQAHTHNTAQERACTGSSAAGSAT
jgi:hypothetical protein